MSMLARKQSEGNFIIEKNFTLEKSEMELIVSFERNFNYDDFKKAVDYLKEFTDDNWYQYVKPVCYYREPASIIHRNKYVKKSEFQCSFFYSEGQLAYTSSGRSGFLISDMSYHLVEKIVVRHKKHPEFQQVKALKLEKLWKRIQKARYDDVTWSHLSKDSFKEESHPFYTIQKVFNSYDMKRIEKAFENKEHFIIKVEKEKRHYSAEGKMGDDGIYRAWFSSEFPWESHGSYYYLLNPTTAVFCEHD